MTNTDRAMIARNEIENIICDLSQDLLLSEEDMILIIDAVSNTIRHKALTRKAYDLMHKEREEAAKAKEEAEKLKEEESKKEEKDVKTEHTAVS